MTKHQRITLIASALDKYRDDRERAIAVATRLFYGGFSGLGRQMAHIAAKAAYESSWGRNA